jgi:hypothetical protein
MPEGRELLLILDAHQPSTNLLQRYRVTQKASPRVVIVEGGDDSTKEELQTIEGVEVVLEPGERPSSDVRGALSDAELLFVDAYAQRARPKKRQGEGLNWDAEGFLPPDKPPNRG